MMTNRQIDKRDYLAEKTKQTEQGRWHDKRSKNGCHRQTKSR